jgi:hypothetical protein
MKVFRVNSCDWVCAENTEQAKEFYLKETGLNEDEAFEDFHEVNIEKDWMYYEVDKLPTEYQDLTLTMRYFGGVLYAKVPFKTVIECENITEPMIIASTEY